MKKCLVFWALLIILGNYFSAISGNLPPDSSSFAYWAKAVNDSGETGIAFVRQSDLAGNSYYPVLYRLYHDSGLVVSDTILYRWTVHTSYDIISLADFAVALDDSGCAHFFSGTDTSCQYLVRKKNAHW
jgi:hypothetical protein